MRHSGREVAGIVNQDRETEAFIRICESFSKRRYIGMQFFNMFYHFAIDNALGDSL